MAYNFIPLLIPIPIILIVCIIGIRYIRNHQHKKDLKILNQIAEKSPYRRPQESRHSKTSRYLGKVDKEKSKEAEQNEPEDPSVTKVQRIDDEGRPIHEAEPDLPSISAFDKGEIVGLAEPVGKWSLKVIKDKLPMFLSWLNYSKQNNKNEMGFWARMVKAQSSSRGHDQSRGR